MQTINFQCGHCRNVMGVGVAYLGKQVRCPHCQQVVLAPAQGPAPAPAPAAAAPRPAPGGGGSAFPPKDEHESIFGEQIDEDLFGAAPKSKVEFPPDAPKPNLTLEPTVFQVPGLTQPAPGGTGFMNNSPSTFTPATGTLSVDGNALPSPGGAAGVLRRPENNIVTTSVLIILIPYSIFITAIAIYLYFRQATASHPLEMLPDLGNPPAKRVSGPPIPVIQVRSYQRQRADTPLLPTQITTLGKMIKLGDLEITPLNVEQRRVLFKYRTGQFKSELSTDEALVMNLEMKNVSKDAEFRPNDVAFDHLWKDGQHPIATLPYTHLELSNGKRYCGPFKWNPGAKAGALGADEYIDGQEQDSMVIKPGETVKTAITTDPVDLVPNALRNQKGNLLWRIQLRRGVVNYQDRDWSVTGVIGVEFDKDDIVKK